LAAISCLFRVWAGSGGLRAANLTKAIVAIGLAIGIAAALVVARLLASRLYGVGEHDPLTFTLVPLALGAIALVASYIPARRATRVDPAVALRCE
jgi:ABC-type lipoprotein release transport system permease subunit